MAFPTGLSMGYGPPESAFAPKLTSVRILCSRNGSLNVQAIEKKRVSYEFTETLVRRPILEGKWEMWVTLFTFSRDSRWGGKSCLSFPCECQYNLFIVSGLEAATLIRP